MKRFKRKGKMNRYAVELIGIIALCLGLLGCNSHPQTTYPDDTPEYRRMIQNMNEFEIQSYTADVKLLQDYALKTVSDAEFADLKAHWEETVHDWAYVKKYTLARGYVNNDFRLSRYVIMNKAKDRLLMLYHVLYNNDEVGAVSLFVGIKEPDGSWEFHHTGLPTFGYHYIEKTRKGIKYTRREMVNRALMRLARDGVVVDGQVNDAYFDKWLGYKNKPVGL